MTTKYEQDIQSRTRFHYFMGGAIRFLNWLKYGATDKPCGVRTVANPKLLLNGT